MLTTLAISNYRSIRDLVMPLGPLNLVTGANGSGKSNLYRALRLLAETAQGGVVSTLAREGGLASTLWAGPETITRRMRNQPASRPATRARETHSRRVPPHPGLDHLSRHPAHRGFDRRPQLHALRVAQGTRANAPGESKLAGAAALEVAHAINHFATAWAQLRNRSSNGAVLDLPGARSEVIRVLK